MFSTSSNNMDNIHVSISDGQSESEETGREIEEELEPESEQQEVLRKKIKKEHRKQVTTKRKSEYYLIFMTQLMLGCLGLMRVQFVSINMV